MFSESDIQKIRDATDIVSLFSERVAIRQRGRDFWCCCPIHQEKTPSCKIDPALQLWHCFGCGKGGDIFKFIMEADSLSFPDAVLKLADRVHIDISDSVASSGIKHSYKKTLIDVCSRSAEFYHTQLMRGKSSKAAAARNYLSSRGFGREVSSKWMLGYAPGSGSLVKHLMSVGISTQAMNDANVAITKNGKVQDRFFDRIIFPICDTKGQCIAFGGRVIDSGEPKYLNSQDTPIFHKSNVLFGFHKAKSAMVSSGIAIVVEGYTDAIALFEAGITNVVATLGTALTKQHIRVLSRQARRKIIYLFDGDEAGQRAADRALGYIDESITPEGGRNPIELAAVTLPDKLDPAEFVAAYGVEELQKLIESALPLLEYGIRRRLDTYDLSTPQGRALGRRQALLILAPIKNSLLAKDYAATIAGLTRAKEDDVLRELSHLTYHRQSESSPFDGTHYQQNSECFDPSKQSLMSSGKLLTSSEKGLLSNTERNRLRFESEFLILCAQHPSCALEYADTLIQTSWHSATHKDLAEAMISVLSEKPSLCAAEFISYISDYVSDAQSILSGGNYTDADSVDALATYLSEELGIGDAEDAIREIQSSLTSLSPEDPEYEDLFESVVILQKDVAERKKHHKPR